MSDAHGGSPPDWPAAPQAGSAGPGYTQPGEPGFTPSFAPDEAAGPLDGTAAGDGYVAPGATVVEPFASPVGSFGNPVAGANGYASAGPNPAPYAASPYVAAPQASPAPRSSAPLVVGISAVVIAVLGAIGFVFYWRGRSVEADNAAPADTIDVPEKKKKAADEEKPAKDDAPTPAPTPLPTPAPTPEPTPTAEPTSPKPHPTAQPTTPKPQPTTQPTTPKPQPTTPKPQPTAPPPPRHIPGLR